MTVIIKNVRPLAAARQLPQQVDVLISGDKISAFGSFPSKGADETIDGQGAYLSPGFVDVNTDSDHYLTLFDDPAQEDFLMQGVTTIIGGQCGSSLAPLIYGGLESVRKWADISKVNVGWHSLAEFVSVLEKKRIGVNFGTLVGHSTIRRALVGESQRALTKNELSIFLEVLKKSLHEGGFGFSTGLGYIHSRNTPYQEIKSFLKIVKNYDGVYATHLRKSGDGLAESIEETLKVHNETGVKTVISHFLPHFGEEEEYEKALEEFAKLPGTSDFNFDVYPFNHTIVPLYTLLPEWAQRDNLETMNKLLQDEWQRSKILKEIPKLEPDSIVVSKAPKNEAVVGHSLGELSSIYGMKNPKDALMRLMMTTNLKAVVFYKNINERLIKTALSHPRSLIASNAASSADKSDEKSLKSERALSTFKKFISLAANENLMPLEKAVRKITSIPAEKFNLRGRGELKEGNFADLVVFGAGEGKDTEIKAVVANGKVAVKDGILKNGEAGKILRHEI